jgi:membrane protein implicated in regulation of membrane protease activity
MSAFSPAIIAAFLTSFGGLGVICTQFKATESPWISAPISLVGAVIIASGVLFFLRFLIGKTESSSESKVATVVGMEATVITPIPENAVGEIAYVQAGTRYTAPAREINNRAVPNGRAVRVVRIVGSQFYVEEIN